MKIQIPTWHQCRDKSDAGELMNPIEEFIHDNEPAGRDMDLIFRSTLVKMLQYVSDETFIEKLHKFSKDNFEIQL